MIVSLVLYILLLSNNLSDGYLTRHDVFFEKGNTEFIFINKNVSYKEAATICKRVYFGRLVQIKTKQLANFIAEAISETDLIYSYLWIGAHTIDANRTMYWIDDSNRKEKPVPFSPEMKKLIINYDLIDELFNGPVVDVVRLRKSPKIENKGDTAIPDDDCLSIGREYRDLPRFMPDNCKVHKSAICERSRIQARRRAIGSPCNSVGGEYSTVPYWILIGNKKYKMFCNRRTWLQARMKCEEMGSSLAVIDNAHAAKVLGFNLKNGRPSIESAWIDATIENLGNHKQPEWRKNKIDKNKFCLLLDQHLHDSHYIVAPCHRTRGYICYKENIEARKTSRSHINNKRVFDIIFNNKNGYRLYYSKVDWFEAYEQCQKLKKKYGAKLVEPNSKKIVQEILCFMNENNTNRFEHIWVGGRYVNNKWIWASNNKSINIKYFHGLNPRLEIDEEYKRLYNCLNFNKGHTLHPLIYGKACINTQSFICAFPKNNLLKLRKDEGIEDSAGLNVNLHLEKNITLRYRSRRLNDEQISKCWKEYS